MGTRRCCSLWQVWYLSSTTSWVWRNLNQRGVTTRQRCIRTADIDNVGKTDRHATLLRCWVIFLLGIILRRKSSRGRGNSLREHLQFPPEKLWVSVFQDDDEAYDIWTKVVGILPQSASCAWAKLIISGRRAYGPCGPCSEIHLDRGPEYGCGSDDCKPGCDCERYLEF